MQAIFLILLTIIYSFVVLGFVDIFFELLEIPLPPFYISVVITMSGFGLGIVSYVLSKLKTNVKNYIITAIFILISIVFFVPYLQLRLNALEESALFLLRIGIFFGLCAIPSTVVYAFLKKQKDILFSSIILIMFFFCYIRFLTGDFSFLTNDISLLILFFVTYLCFIELINKSFYFKSTISRIKADNEENKVAIKNLNKVMNRYFVYLAFFYGSCYLFTYFIFFNNISIGLFNIEAIIGSDINSLNITLFLVILFLISMFIFWLVAPMKKNKKVKKTN